LIVSGARLRENSKKHQMNHFLIKVSILIILLGVFSCKGKNKNEKSNIITGFKEGTTSFRKFSVKDDLTFSFEKVDFFNEEKYSGSCNIQGNKISLFDVQKKIVGEIKIDSITNEVTYEHIGSKSSILYLILQEKMELRVIDKNYFQLRKEAYEK
jgi:hypothetical protein